MPDSTRYQQRCAHCGSALRRVPREPADSEQPAFRRYRCRSESCAWEGLLPPLMSGGRSGSAGRAGALRVAGLGGLSWRSLRRRARAIWLQCQTGAAHALARIQAAWIDWRSSRTASRKKAVGGSSSLLVLALGTVLAGIAVALLGDTPPAPPTSPAPAPAANVPRYVAPPSTPGASHDGALLPTHHALHRVSLDSVAVHQPQQAALQLRHSCRWGVPGRNPYRGTVEQALYSAGLGPEVVQVIAAQVRAGQPVDEVVIDNDGIRAQRSGRVFNSRNIAMSYGLTLCLGTQVNFVAGHRERADLYEASDARGRKVAVMIPEVCGNVSVLGEAADSRARAHAAGDASDTAATRSAAQSPADDDIVRWMPALLDWDATVQARHALAVRRSVSEPGTLACVLVALGWVGWVGRLRLKRS